MQTVIVYLPDGKSEVHEQARFQLDNGLLLVTAVPEKGGLAIAAYAPGHWIKAEVSGA